MASNLNVDAAHLGVVVLSAGTPEAMTAVMDKWLDEHFGVEVHGTDMHVVANGAILLQAARRLEVPMEAPMEVPSVAQAMQGVMEGTMAGI